MAYVCQECGHAPKYDFDYIVMYKCGSKSGWYCTYCGCKYDEGMMNGTIAIKIRGDIPGGFIARISMPGGNLPT